MIALRELSRSTARRQAPVESVVEPAVRPCRPELRRCECRDCGAHSNAIVARDVHASCPNCGASRLVPVEGSEVILTTRD